MYIALDPNELNVNKYHHQVYETLIPHLTEEEKEWLKENTAEI